MKLPEGQDGHRPERRSSKGTSVAFKFHARERRKSLYDPAFGLFGTHTFAPDATGILTGTVFPDCTKPITAAVTVKRTGASPQGVILELGSSTTGFAIWFSGADDKLYAAAGDGTVVANDVIWIDGDVYWTDGDIVWLGDPLYTADGLTLTGPESPQGQVIRIVFSVIPGAGKARLWVNGVLVANGTESGGFGANGWSDAEAGAVGQISGSATSRVPMADRITLTNAAIISPVTMFHNQRPRQFFEVA